MCGHVEWNFDSQEGVCACLDFDFVLILPIPGIQHISLISEV